MNRFICGFVCLVVVACAVHAADKVLTDEVVQSYANAFERYQVKFNKHYANEEEYRKHLRAYAASMEEVKELNAKHAGEGVTFGETSRSDLLDEEKGSYAELLPFDPAKHGTRAYGRNTFPQPAKAVQLGHTANNVPASFNWFNVSGVKHPARNQGSCGSCWTFGGIGALEMQAVLEGHTWIDMSRQQAVDCVRVTNHTQGCCGGWYGYIYDQINASGYISEADYPYELVSTSRPCNPSSCRSSGKPTVDWIVNGHDSFSPMNASALKKEIWMYGPLTVWINAADGFHSYQSGIFKCTSSEATAGHAVIAVGFGPNYIVIRNSWGTDWGLDGDMLVSTDSEVASCLMLKNRGYTAITRVSVKPKEQCTSGACCNTTSKLFLPVGTVCRAKNGACDVAEKCTGDSATCPDDGYAPAGTVCDASTDVCENNATCTGSSKTCPTKTFKAAGTICRSKTGACDVAETCTGNSAACPADEYAPAGTVCANASGVCQNDAVCTGDSKTCPAKTFKPASTVCRAKNGTCDVEETCTGNTSSCPSDEYAPAGTVCNPASGLCENDGVCSGKSTVCPVNKTLKANGTICRNATGLCDVPEVCDGISIECPPDEYLPMGTPCRLNCPGVDENASSSLNPSSSINVSSSITPCDSETYNCTGESPYCPPEEPVVYISSSLKLKPQYVIAAMMLMYVML